MLSIVFIYVFTVIYCKENCPIYKINNDDRPSNMNCIEKNEDDNVLYYYQCPKEESFKYCPFTFDIDTIQCSPIPITKRYPGIACNIATDCISNICEHGLCVGIDINQPCDHVSDCAFGLTCRDYAGTNICLQPLHVGHDCQYDTDCDITCGCLNSKCTAYYSLYDKHTVNAYDDFTIHDNGNRFCQSYHVHNGKCETLRNYYYDYGTYAADTADVPCHYINRYSEIYTLNNRQCGLNGKAYCPIGNGEEEYEDYITLAKVTMYNNTRCHIAERFKPCQKDLFNTDEYNLSLNRTNTFLKAESVLKQHRFNTQEIEFLKLKYDKDYKEDIPTLELKCPVFRCYDKIDNDNKCLQSNTGFEKNAYSISVNLSNVCLETEYCTVNGYNPEMLMQGNNLTGKCIPIPLDFYPLRYPGENCSDINSCIPIPDKPYLGKCDIVAKQCTGSQLNNKCTDHIECVAGLYCNKTTGCQKQKEKGIPCTTSYECLNNLLCYNKTCQDKLYAIKENNTILVDNTDPIPWEKFCEFETRYNQICIELKEDLSQKTLTNSFIPTNTKQCLYQTIIKDYTVSKKSRCGYNAKGFAYCPLGQNTDRDIWRKYYKSKARKYNNKCHTLSRFNCYLSDSHALTDIAFYSHYLDKGHYYHDAVDCAIDVLNSPYLSFKATVFISIILMILIG